MTKIIFKPILATMFLMGSLVSNQVFAVDGYKNLKFGISLNETLINVKCSFEDADSGLPGVQMISCPDFSFGADKVSSAMLYIDGKLLRIIIEPSVELVDGILAGLMKKYGEPSFRSPEEDFHAIDQFPNRQAELGWDNDTVFLRFLSDQFGNQGILLIYTSPEYDKQMLLNQEQSLGDDL